jgi:DNA processing protein
VARPASADEALGLALLAHGLNRDLQRAARAAGGAGALWRMGPAAQARLLRVAEADVRAAATRDALAAARGRLEAAGVSLVAAGDVPERLRQVFDPPFGLFAEGDWARVAGALTERPVVAVVGTRRPTAAGRRFALGLAAELAARGAVIVSGLALGVDGAAHEGALEAGGDTVAVLGCGLDHDYPRAHRALRARLRERGAVISEYWCETAPAPWRFPARNRIVAGLAHATVVVEARGRSGALITADFALEAGRVALAVPGPPWADASQGCNELIRAGAGVCTGAQDVVDELPHAAWGDTQAEADAVAAPVGDRGVLYGLVRAEPMRIDQLAATARITPAATAAALASLEVDGLVLRGEGQRYWAVRRAT